MVLARIKYYIRYLLFHFLAMFPLELVVISTGILKYIVLFTKEKTCQDWNAQNAKKDWMRSSESSRYDADMTKNKMII